MKKTNSLIYFIDFFPWVCDVHNSTFKISPYISSPWHLIKHLVWQVFNKVERTIKANQNGQAVKIHKTPRACCDLACCDWNPVKQNDSIWSERYTYWEKMEWQRSRICGHSNITITPCKTFGCQPVQDISYYKSWSNWPNCHIF